MRADDLTGRSDACDLRTFVFLNSYLFVKEQT